MRTLEDARPLWAELERLDNLQQLRDIIAESTSSVVTGQRSVCWKAFLLFENLDRTTWPTLLSESRDAYISLRTHFLHAIEHPDEIDFVLDPLSDNQDSPWNSLRADEELRAEIYQDVERCMPENVYFRQPETQKMLLDILFIFCKLNPDVGYRQGMHEVVAPILWVIERDAIDPASISRASQRDELLLALLDKKYIEHDTFTLFALVMQNAKSFYEQPDAKRQQSSKAHSSVVQAESPMLARCRKIFELYLPRVDSGLATHLKEIDIVPQIFLMRWVRLLFGREFPFDQVLGIWDMLFSQDPSLDLIDLICVAMLLRIRWQLIEADTNTALTLLLRYPEPAAPQPPKTFVKDALYLKAHLSPDGGNHIVSKYTNRPLPLVSRVDSLQTQPQLQTRVSGRSAHRISAPKAAAHHKSPSGGIESILQNAARDVYTRGEQWGVNKAVRDAASSMRKNIVEIQSSRGASPRLRLPDFLSPTPSSEAVVTKVELLEQRNKALAKMLEKAVDELWAYQKDKADQKEEKEELDKLSTAIGAVQFVQVHLADSTVPLLTEEDERPNAQSPQTTSSQRQKETSSIAPAQKASTIPPSQNPPVAPTPTLTIRRKESRSLKRGSISDSSKAAAAVPITSTPTISTPLSRSPPTSTSSIFTPATISTPTALTPFSQSPPVQSSFSHQPAKSNLPVSRPALAQSSFSWMLGQGEGEQTPREAFGAGMRYVSSNQITGSGERDKKAREKARVSAKKGKGFLFGEEEWEMEGS